jgi:hypothetical protein
LVNLLDKSIVDYPNIALWNLRIISKEYLPDVFYKLTAIFTESKEKYLFTDNHKYLFKDWGNDTPGRLWDSRMFLNLLKNWIHIPFLYWDEIKKDKKVLHHIQTKYESLIKDDYIDDKFSDNNYDYEAYLDEKRAEVLDNEYQEYFEQSLKILDKKSIFKILNQDLVSYFSSLWITEATIDKSIISNSDNKKLKKWEVDESGFTLDIVMLISDISGINIDNSNIKYIKELLLKTITHNNWNAWIWVASLLTTSAVIKADKLNKIGYELIFGLFLNESLAELNTSKIIGNNNQLSKYNFWMSIDIALHTLTSKLWIIDADVPLINNNSIPQWSSIENVVDYTFCVNLYKLIWTKLNKDTKVTPDIIKDYLSTTNQSEIIYEAAKEIDIYVKELINLHDERKIILNPRAFKNQNVSVSGNRMKEDYTEYSLDKVIWFDDDEKKKITLSEFVLQLSNIIQWKRKLKNIKDWVSSKQNINKIVTEFKKEQIKYSEVFYKEAMDYFSILWHQSINSLDDQMSLLLLLEDSILPLWTFSEEKIKILKYFWSDIFPYIHNSPFKKNFFNSIHLSNEDIVKTFKEVAKKEWISEFSREFISKYKLYCTNMWKNNM